MEPIQWLQLEEEAYHNGYLSVCCIDEAGRGPLAGPVCAGAVIFERGTILEGVNDSKKLTEKKREQLFERIKSQAVAWSVGWASVEEIERMNILNAALLAMKRAQEGLPVQADYALVDGNQKPPLKIPCKTVIKGDGRSLSIAAASILAKVSRDRLMLELSHTYPQYQFEKHKGYGTKLHRDLLLSYGPSPVHRRSFLKKILPE